MTNLNFIDTLPFKIELNESESKIYHFTNDIHEFIVKFNNELNISISLISRNGFLNKNDYNSDIKINRKSFSKIVFENKNNIKTSVILDNLT